MPPAAANTTSALGKLRLGQFTATGGSFQAAPVVPVMLANTSALGLAYFTLFIAALELADQRNIHAAHKPDLAGLAGHGRHHAHQKLPSCSLNTTD